MAALAASTRREGARTFLLVPLRALAEEKFDDLSRKYSKWGLGVAISTHDRAEFDENLTDYQVIVSTYEKLNALLVRRPQLLTDLGVVVVDELQNVGEWNRGATLEALLTRLVVSSERPQIVALSATISNPIEVARWLKAELATTDKRDVDLREGILYRGEDRVKFNGFEVSGGDFLYKDFNSGTISVEKSLNLNTLQELGEIATTEQLLVFTDTQKHAEDTARLLASFRPSSAGVNDIMRSLEGAVEPTPSTRRLKETIENGVAFHHAGLLPEEREIVEQSFQDGIVRIICATTTLAAGINTPAKNVIIVDYQTYEGRSIRTRDYKNMSGRAGRIREADNFGRSVLFASNERELQMLWREYVTAKPEFIESQIRKPESLGKLIMGLACSGVCPTTDDLLRFIKSTFFGVTYYDSGSKEFKGLFDESLRIRVNELVKSGFLVVRNEEIKPTDFGKRCADEMLSPETGLVFREALDKLHTIVSPGMDFSQFAERVIHIACCSEQAAENGALVFPPRSEAERKELEDYWEYNRNSFLYHPSDPTKILRTLRTTRMLMRWIEGNPYNELSSYARQGVVRKDAEVISWLVKGISRIAGPPLFRFDIGFMRYLHRLSYRLLYGVPDSALAIMRLNVPGVHRHRAIRLAEKGFDSVDKLVQAKPEQLMTAEGISETLALEIKKHVESFIDDLNLKDYQRQRRIAQTLGKNVTIIDRLYNERGDNFARAFNDIFKNYLGLDSAFVGDAAQHHVDVIIETKEGKIAVEGKRVERRNVSAIEAEEVIGKGSKFDPIANVTIGYPDFSDEAVTNSPKSRVTLIPAWTMGEMLLAFWKERLSKEKICQVLKRGRYVDDIDSGEETGTP